MTRRLLLVLVVVAGMVGVWVSPASADVDLAIARTCTISNQYLTYACARAFDSDDTTTAIATSSQPAFVRVDLGSAINVQSFTVVNAQFAANSAKLQYSTNDSTWTDVYTGIAGSATTSDSLTTPGITARYWRLLNTDGNGLNIARLSLYGTSTGAATTGASGGTVCGGSGQVACKVDIGSDSGGFFSGLSSAVGGIGSAVGSALSSPLSAISSAITAMGSFIVDGFSALLLPSGDTTSGVAEMWDTATTRFPFSVATELVTLPSTVLGSIQSGIAAGPPSDCSTYLCGSTGAISAVSVYAPVSTLRNVCGFILVAMFAYGVLRSIGQAIK